MKNQLHPLHPHDSCLSHYFPCCFLSYASFCPDLVSIKTPFYPVKIPLNFHDNYINIPYPMVFIWFSCSFHMVLQLLYGFSAVVPWFSQTFDAFPKVFPRAFQLPIAFPMLFPRIFPGFSQPPNVFRGTFAPVPSSSARRNRWATSAPPAQRPPQWRLPGVNG